jgi:hypothetical protein
MSERSIGEATDENGSELDNIERGEERAGKKMNP